jgi:YggT family protein
MLSTALGFLIDVVFGLFTYALLLRLVMQVMRAPFRNPLGQAVMALTDRIVKPLRKVLPGVGGIDWASVIAAYVFQFAWLLALYFAFGRGFALLGPGLAFVAVAALIAIVRALLWLTIIVVFAQAILSWVAPDGPLAGVLNALTFPLLRPVRRLVPPIGGTLDLSPLIVIVVAQLILITLVPWLEAGATRLFL